MVLVTNVVFIQREIADYGELSRPYAACVAALAPHLADLGAGETVIVADVGPRDAIAVLAGTMSERHNMNKLIPYRKNGIDGLIELPDLVNTVRRERGRLGRRIDVPASGARRFVAYDGERAWLAPEPAHGTIPDERLFAVRFDDAARYFDSAPALP